MKFFGIILGAFFWLWIAYQFLQPLDTVASTIFIILVISGILYIQTTKKNPNQLVLSKKTDIPEISNYYNSNSLSREEAIKIINTRKFIKEPGKYQLKVESVVDPKNEVQNDFMIVNLSAMSDLHLADAKRMFRERKYQEAVNIHFNSFQRPGKDYLPVKGEMVAVTIDYKNKDKTNHLTVVSLIEEKVQKPDNVKI